MFNLVFILTWTFSMSSIPLVSSSSSGHSIAKRQTGAAPTFSQSSYSFTLSSCNAGTSIGTIFATNPTGGQVGYTIDPASVRGYFVVLGYLTGQMTLSTNLIYSPITFNVRAANSNGVTVVPVTITCSGLNNGFNTGFTSINTFNNFATSSIGTQTLTGTNCFAGGIVGTVYSTIGAVSGYTISGNNQFIINANTGQITISNTAGSLGSGTYFTNVQAYTSGGSFVTIPVQITLSCSNSGSIFGGTIFGTTNSFSQSSYFFTTSGCFAGSSVGNFFANGATNYFITNGNGLFTVSPSGFITTTTAVPAGTYSLTIQSTSSFGTTASVPVTITVTCNNIGTGTGFSQSSYFFTTSNCIAGSTVGSVFANGASNYFLTSTTGQFFISSSGVITIGSSLSTGTYTLNVQSSTGSTVPVTISVTCSGTGTGTFSQTSYSFTTSTCTSGSTVGSVFANGATSYFLSSGSGQFAVSSSGLLTLATAVPAGTYSATVSATGSFGTASVPVTITVSCTGSGTTGVTPTFNQPFYAFTINSCNTFGTTSTIGSVTASGATSYSINFGSGRFFIDGSGNLTAASGLTAGTYSASVVATGSNGAQVAVPVTVTVACNG